MNELLRSRTLFEGHHKGYRYIVCHNGRGYRCGYVQIPEGHIWHGRESIEHDATIKVHGGITGADDIGGLWWVYFDCAHCDDRCDPSLPGGHAADGPVFRAQTIRTTEYVAEQCRKLIDQAVDRDSRGHQIRYELRRLREAEEAADSIKRKLFVLGYGVDGSYAIAREASR